MLVICSLKRERFAFHWIILKFLLCLVFGFFAFFLDFLVFRVKSVKLVVSVKLVDSVKLLDLDVFADFTPLSRPYWDKSVFELVSSDAVADSSVTVKFELGRFLMVGFQA